MDALNSWKGYFENAIVNVVNNATDAADKIANSNGNGIVNSINGSSKFGYNKQNNFNGIVPVDDVNIVNFNAEKGLNRLIICGYLGHVSDSHNVCYFVK